LRGFSTWGREQEWVGESWVIGRSKERGKMASMPVFLASGNRMKRVMWDTKGTHADLATLHKKGANTRHSSTPPRNPPTRTSLTTHKNILEEEFVKLLFGSFFFSARAGGSSGKRAGRRAMGCGGAAFGGGGGYAMQHAARSTHLWRSYDAPSAGPPRWPPPQTFSFFFTSRLLQRNWCVSLLLRSTQTQWTCHHRTACGSRRG
jgi:hypothetical protein